MKRLVLVGLLFVNVPTYAIDPIFYGVNAKKARQENKQTNERVDVVVQDVQDLRLTVVRNAMLLQELAERVNQCGCPQPKTPLKFGPRPEQLPKPDSNFTPESSKGEDR